MAYLSFFHRRPPGKVYDWDNDEFVAPKNNSRSVRYQDDGPAAMAPAPAPQSSMSDRTRNLLDQVKESTMALQDLNSGEHEVEYERPQMRRRSRNQAMIPPPEEEEYMQPPPQPRFSSSSGRRSYGRSVSMDEPQQPPPRYSAATSLADEVLYGGPRLDEPRRGGRSEAFFEPPPAASTGWKDTEDVDAMIADLKKKTSGRDMRQVLRDIEHSGGGGGGGGMDYGSQFAADRRSAVGFGADYDDDFERGGGGGLSTRNGDGSGSRQLGISRGGIPRGEEGPAGMGDWKGGGGRMRRSTARNSSVDGEGGGAVVPPPARSRWGAAAASPPPRPSTQRTSFDVGDEDQERSRGKFKSGGGIGGGETEFGAGSFGAGRRSLGNRMRIASPIEGEDSD